MGIEKLKKENEVIIVSQPNHPGCKKVAAKNYVCT